jgi:hypothetical protein
VSTLNEQINVRCSLNQASRLVHRFFRAHGNADGDIARLRLHISARVPGASEPMTIERVALATIVPRNVPGAMLGQYAVTWTPEDHGPYPMFVGTLAITSGDDYDSFFISLSGEYAPPFGAFGAAFDALIGHRIAEATARNLLETMASEIESDFRAAEAAKVRSRNRVQNVTLMVGD